MASIADVYVTVLPETSKIADGIKKALRGVDDDVRQAARRWARDIERELGRPEVEVDADTNLMSPPAKVVRDAELSAEQRRDAAFATPLLAFALAS